MFTFRFMANDPGVFMYHCGTPPVLAHIANGMYGAIVVDPRRACPRRPEYVLVASEWYLNGDGISEPAGIDMAKARAWCRTDDLQRLCGSTSTRCPPRSVRSPLLRRRRRSELDTAFHVVGTLLDRAYMDGTTKRSQNLQTVSVPAGGGAVFDVHIDEDGLYPFVSHSFAASIWVRLVSSRSATPGHDVPLSFEVTPGGESVVSGQDCGKARSRVRPLRAESK